MGNRNSKLVVGLSGSLVFVIAVIVLFNIETQLSTQEAQDRIKLVLSKEIIQNYNNLFDDENTLSYGTALQLEEELMEIKNTTFNSVKIRRLILDYVLRPHRPTHIVRAEMTIHDETFPPRYFWLSWASIDRETSKTAWYFSL